MSDALVIKAWISLSTHFILHLTQLLSDLCFSQLLSPFVIEIPPHLFN